MNITKKIKTEKEIVSLVDSFKKKGKKVVLSHGIFDLIHPGIIRHLMHAKRQGDILVVSVIKNKDVRKGPSRPIFNETMRLENVASIEGVAYTCLVDDKIPFECIKRIKPTIFARGEDYSGRDQLILKRLKYQEKAIASSGCKVFKTTGFTSSSSSIINKFLDIYPDKTKNFLKDFSAKYTPVEIIQMLKNLKDMKVLVIGDAIIDEYHYCISMGKSSKEPLVVSRYMSSETFAGGALAVANHIAGLCKNVNLVSVLGKKNSKEGFLRRNLRKNIKCNFFYRDDAPTTTKRRYIEQYFNQKLFEICFMNDSDIPKYCESKIQKYLNSCINNYDLVLVSDFGHGLFSKGLINLISKKAKIMAVNAQTNSANTGFNLITKYNKAHFICLDENEARLAAQDRYESINGILTKISKQVSTKYISVTRGSHGSIGFSAKNGFNYTPALSSKVVDRIGAGDAFFAFSAPCFAKNMPYDLISFIGNAVGAMAVQIVCNKEPVEPEKLYEFIETLLS